jgi:hypothetical protein
MAVAVYLLLIGTPGLEHLLKPEQREKGIGRSTAFADGSG